MGTPYFSPFRKREGLVLHQYSLHSKIHSISGNLNVSVFAQQLLLNPICVFPLVVILVVFGVAGVQSVDGARCVEKLKYKLNYNEIPI